jgi:Zn-dependent M16 (insulinase) family peptidase
LERSLEEHYEILKTWSSKQWTEMLSKYYEAPSRLVVRGRPSASLADKLKTEEKARLKEQVKRLGPEGLAELEKKLAAAKDEHEQPIPEEVLTGFPVPDVKSISWISVQSANNVSSPAVSRTLKSSSTDSSELERHLQKDTTSFPMRVQFDHVTVCSHKAFILRNTLMPQVVRLYQYSRLDVTGELAGRSAAVSYSIQTGCHLISATVTLCFIK